MPSRQVVNAFVAAVREGRFVQAIEDWYAPAATMRENLGAPRGGRDALVAHERAVLAADKSIVTREAEPVVVDGDKVVIRWLFEMTAADGTVRRLDELALQTWRGDKIVAEQFYYDPGQFARPAA
jgi:ketosteroid isomerase-like protein